MAVMYRALWCTDYASSAAAEEAVGKAREAFSAWATHDRLPELDDGDYETPERSGRIRVVEGDVGAGFEGSAVDQVAGDEADRWSTFLRIGWSGERVWTWVDNHFETTDTYSRVSVGAPRLVDDLLRLPGEHRLGSSSISVGPLSVEASEVPSFVADLRDEERQLPVVVFTEPPGAVNDNWLRRAARCARRLSGIAQVRTLDDAAVGALRTELGELAVWGGGIRTYTLAPLDGATDGYRHRYIPHYRLGSQDQAVATLLVNRVAPLSVRRRAPRIFDDLFVDSAIDEATVRQAEQDRDHYMWQYELAVEEREGIESELARAQGHLDRLVRALRGTDMEGVFWQSADPVDDVPDEVEDTTQAVLFAQEYLSETLLVPEGVDQELGRIDSAAESRAWGNSTWRGLRALSAYATARAEGFEGGFWAWCEKGDARAWPATTKKLAMVESETVRNNARFMETRRFPISTAVDASGRVHMESHLKISEGGGDLAPRVYFYDDTAGPTRKVHVGFIGPHFLVPNTKS